MIAINNKRESIFMDNTHPKSKRRKTTPQQQFIQTTGPHSNDVLCGRGGLVNKYSGNVAFRRVVVANKNNYHSCPKSHKFLLSQSIVEAIMKQNPPGRFLSQEKGTGKWFDIGKAKAIQKTSQALRENSEKIRKELDAEPSNKPSDFPTGSFPLKANSLQISSSKIPNFINKSKNNSSENIISDCTSSVGSLDESDIESLTSSLECIAPADMDNFIFFNDNSIFDDSIDKSLDTFLHEARVDEIPPSAQILDAYTGISIPKSGNSSSSDASLEPLDKDDPTCNSRELLSTLNLCRGIWEL